MYFMVEGLRYARLNSAFVKTLQPYEHQVKTLNQVREAIKQRQTICIENTSVTGSGKTLANFAAAILDGIRTCGIYPTNELMLDQFASLYNYVPEDIAILDSQGLDDIRDKLPHMRTHAHALNWATGDEKCTAALTNPDVLYLAMYNLYGQMFSTFSMNYGVRIFQNVLSNYPVIAFDEFHLYNAKQIANAAFIIGTAKELAPDKPHIFIFSSATPQEQFKHYVKRLGLEIISVTDAPSKRDDSRVVCEPLHIHLLPADLLHWQGGDTIRATLGTILQWADSQRSPARGVFIVDSVYEAKLIAEDLRKQYKYNPKDIGEVHGYMDSEARADALQRRFSVGTTTIDVGVDLTDAKSKEFLVCEARSAAQAIQRIGRLGRHGRESSNIPVPNTIWLLVPEYVYNYIEHQEICGTSIIREKFNKILNEAYLSYETFHMYTTKYSPLEAVAACERIQRLYFEDTEVQAQEKLHNLVPTLYDKEAPSDQQQAEKRYLSYRKQQRAVWRKYGTEIKGSFSKSPRYYLSDLESFRGGLESDFIVAIYDDLDERLGLRKPVKTYALPFVLRRTHFDELSRQQFIDLLERKHPQHAKEWWQQLERQRNLLGYVHVQGLIEGKAKEVYFEISKSHIDNEFQQVIRLQGFTISGDNIHLRTGVDSINSELEKRVLNCWVSEHNSFKLSETRRLPPLFALYPLHALNTNGTFRTWSIAFGLDAFFLDCITYNRRTKSIRIDNTAIIL